MVREWAQSIAQSSIHSSIIFRNFMMSGAISITKMRFLRMYGALSIFKKWFFRMYGAISIFWIWVRGLKTLKKSYSPIGRASPLLHQKYTFAHRFSFSRLLGAFVRLRKVNDFANCPLQNVHFTMVPARFWKKSLVRSSLLKATLMWRLHNINIFLPDFRKSC